MLNQQIDRAYLAQQGIPQYKRAVPTLTPLTTAYGQMQGGQMTQEMGTNLQRLGMNNQLANAKEDIRLAKKDSTPALLLGLGNVGLRGLGAYEQNKFNKQQEEEMQKQSEEYEVLRYTINNDFQRLMDILTGKAEKQALPALTPVNTQGASAKPRTGGYDLRTMGQNVNPDYGYGNRQDGTPKGRGYLGEITNATDNSSMTELSMGVQFDGKNMEIPLMVPTLNKDEVNWLRNYDFKTMTPNNIPETIKNKAIGFARQRLQSGKPVWALPNESPNNIALEPVYNLGRVK